MTSLEVALIAVVPVFVLTLGWNVCPVTEIRICKGFFKGTAVREIKALLHDVLVWCTGAWLVKQAFECLITKSMLEDSSLFL